MIGISRHIDELGRITIPKEVRDTLNMNCGCKCHIIPTEEGIIIKKDEQDIHTEIQALIDKYDMNCPDIETINRLKMIERERGVNV